MILFKLDIKKPGRAPAQVIDYLNCSMGWSFLKIDVENMKAEISLLENSLYIVKDGKVTQIPAIQHGEDTIVWKNGQVLDLIRSERVRV